MTIPPVCFGNGGAQQIKINFQPSRTEPVEVLVKGRSAEEDAKIARNNRRFKQWVAQERKRTKQPVLLRSDRNPVISLVG